MPRRPTCSRLLLSAALLALNAGRLSAQATREDTTSGNKASPDAKAVVAADFYVDDDNAGPQDGTALRPFRTVQQAVDAAKDNAVIAVAGGTYAENIRVQDKAVRLYGGYVGGTKAHYASGAAGKFRERDPGAQPSHLKGNGKDSVVTLYEAGATTVDGFRITGGGRSATAAPLALGGGFYIYSGAPTIANNLIENNKTCPPVPQEQENFGGGIYAASSSVSILNNVIRNNVSGRGAGISAEGAMITIRGNTVERNIGVSDHGGGIFLYSSNAEISYNRVVDNEIGRKLGYGWGGGIIVFNKGGNYKFSHNVFTGNFAPSVGSAVFVDDGAVASLSHDLIYANAANPAGNGAVPPVYVDGNETGEGGAGLSSTLMVDHVTIADHSGMPTVNGNAITVTWNSKVTIKNSVFWNNGGDDVEADGTSKAIVSHTLSQESLPGIGNVSRDPQFVDAARHDYRLRTPADGNSGRANLGFEDDAENADKGAR
jgi:hypothetical protein